MARRSAFARVCRTFALLVALAASPVSWATCTFTPAGQVLGETCTSADKVCVNQRGERLPPDSCPDNFMPPGCPLPPDCQGNAMNCTSAITPCVCGNLPGMSIRSDFFGRDYCGPTRNCKGPWCNREFKLRPQIAVDPNVKTGPTGVSDAAFVVSGIPLAYTVQFENLPSATGAAQVVIVTDQLDVQKLDLDTFELGPISFGERALVPPPDSQSYAGGVDLRPGQDLIVTVVAGLDRSTGLVTWTFTSIDPNTGQLTEDPAAGFLPPNTSPPAGEGTVTFSVASKPSLATGTSVANQASIVFDINAAIETPTWLNTIDRSAPLTHVLPLAATVSSPEFTVEWAGTDAGAGMLAYTVYVSDNGGPFTRWIDAEPITSATFTGEMNHTYRFFSIGDDRVGNAEPMKTLAEATTTVVPVALAGAVSRKVHGASGTFDLPLSLATDGPTVEPRSGGGEGEHTIVFVFDQPVSAGDVSVSAGTATPGTPTFAGNEMIVPLSGVGNQQFVTLSVSNVATPGGGVGGFGSVRVGFLLGDVNQNRVVTVSDLAQVNAQIAQAVSAANFLKDVNATGTLTVADKAIANTQITRALPAP